VRELLAAGAPLRCVDALERNALHFACAQGDARSVAALLAADAVNALVDARDSGGNSPLMFAARNGHEGAVRLLLARGARVGLQSANGFTAMHEAAFDGHAGVVALLCATRAAAAVVAMQVEGGFLPLTLAIANGGGGEALVATLLAADAAGVTLNVRDSSDVTPLMLATSENCEGAVRALLARGACQELQGLQGLTALHLAVHGGRTGIVELLCAAPGAAAAIATRDDSGHTPLAHAIEGGHAGCEAVLRAHGATE
jgi:ankyrin repeat/protein kinase domain-containing protein 1